MSPGELFQGRQLPQAVKRISTGYMPRRLQELLHHSLKRFNVLVCHRRFGKTVFAINELIDKALQNTLRNPQYAYIAPTYKQAKMIAWEYLKDYTKKIPGSEYNKQELTVYIYREATDDHIKIILLGAENPDGLRGLYLDGAILDEYAQCDPIVWGQIVRPALADRKGWAIFIGTPKGQNHFYHRFLKAQAQPESWFTAIYKASETGILDDEELREMKADMEDDEVQQELECDFTAAILGSYFAKQMNVARKEGRITDVPWNPGFPVDTFWDIGVGDATTIWFRQRIGERWHYIDYYTNNGKGVEHYIKMLRQKTYTYGKHVWPWDGKVRSFSTGQSRQQTAIGLGLRPEIQDRQAIDDRINASRNRLHNCLIDKIKCARGIDCLQNYQKEWDSKNMMFKKTHKKDWAEQGSSSFGYSSLDDRAGTFSGASRNNLPRIANGEYNELD